MRLHLLSQPERKYQRKSKHYAQKKEFRSFQFSTRDLVGRAVADKSYPNLKRVTGCEEKNHFGCDLH